MGAGRPDCSFSKAYRLASSKDFERVYRGGKRGRVGPFGWHARPGANDHPRLGLAVPRRVVKKATDRSRLKRVVRESFRRNRHALPALDIIVSVRAAVGDVRDPALNVMADRLWRDVSSVVNETPQHT